MLRVSCTSFPGGSIRWEEVKTEGPTHPFNFFEWIRQLVNLVLEALRLREDGVSLLY